MNSLNSQVSWRPARCRHARHSFAGAGAAAASVIAKAILGVEGEIGMAWPVFVLNVAVVAAALIAISEQDADWRAVGAPLEDAGPDLGKIFFLSLRDNRRLSRPTTPQVGQKDPRRSMAGRAGSHR